MQRRVAAGVLSAGHARALLSLDDPDTQDHLAHRIVAEGLSVRAVEEIVTMGDVRPVKVRRTAARPAASPALDELATRPAAEIDRAFRGFLDAASHRYDAWATSLATRRLDAVRDARCDYYYVTETYTEVENGQTVTRTRQVLEKHQHRKQVHHP